MRHGLAELSFLLSSTHGHRDLPAIQPFQLHEPTPVALIAHLHFGYLHRHTACHQPRHPHRRRPRAATTPCPAAAMNCRTVPRVLGRVALRSHRSPWRTGASVPLLSRHIVHSTPRLDKCCSSKKKDDAPQGERPAAPIGFWSSRPTWHRASLNTLRCLVGCTTGDFSAMWLLQSHCPDLGMPAIMGISSM